MATDLRIEAANQPGQLAAIGEALGNAGVNIAGMGAVVSGGQGILHLLVDDAAPAKSALGDAGFDVSAERDAVVIDVTEDRPGYLGGIARKLADAGVNLEAAYLATNSRIVLVAEDAAAVTAAM